MSGVAGGTISLGISQSPTGCNPHTILGDTPATRMILGAVLPSPFTISPSGSPTPNPNLIVQSELVSTKPETIVYTLEPQGGLVRRHADHGGRLHLRLGNSSGVTPTPTRLSWPARPATATSRRSREATRARRLPWSSSTPFADWQMLFANLLPAHIMEKVGWNPTCAIGEPGHRPVGRTLRDLLGVEPSRSP